MSVHDYSWFGFPKDIKHLREPPAYAAFFPSREGEPCIGISSELEAVSLSDFKK